MFDLEKYISIFCDEKRDPLQDKELSDFESKLGYKLPLEYKGFLKKNAGLRFADHRSLSFRNDGTCESICISGFYGLIRDAPEYSVDSFFQKSLFENYEDILKIGFLPIAYSPGAEFLVIKLENKSDEDNLGQLRPGSIAFSPGLCETLGHDHFVAPSLKSYFKRAKKLTDEHYEKESELTARIISEESIEALEEYLKMGFSLNQIVSNGNTLADWATFERKYKILEILINRGAVCPRFFYYANSEERGVEAFDPNLMEQIMEKLSK